MRSLTSASTNAATPTELPETNGPGLRVSFQGFLVGTSASGPRVVQYVLRDQARSVPVEEGTRKQELIAPRAAPTEDVLRQRELLEAKQRQATLLQQIPAESGFSWLLERQIIFHDGRTYVHDGPTDTLPSHDLAHLLVGLTSQLPWCPTGSDTEVRLSEFNAALLENLLTYMYQHVALQSVRLEEVLPRTVQYARWFVEKHYAPFPIPLEEAYRRFCLGIDVEAVTDLAHYFFTQKEREARGTRDGPWEMVLIRHPPADLSTPVQQYTSLVRSTVESMRSAQLRAQPNEAPLTVQAKQDAAAARGSVDSRAEDPQRSQELAEARERQKALLRHTPSGAGYSWLRERQIMFHRRRIYVHEGPTDTLPSHDLAHLLVGMGSNLPWCPTGADAEVRSAEFNAAVLENLLSFMYEHVACRSIGLEEVIPKTVQYARWFVEKHYAPFPMPLEEAYRRFCLGIQIESITNLCHYFFTQKASEHHGGRRDGPWEMRLLRQAPSGLDAPVQQFQALIGSALHSMRARQFSVGAASVYL
jgi:hypothetical protein